MNLRNILLGAISVAAVAAMADSAAAQTSATASAPAAAKIIQPLTMTAVGGTKLNFGTMTKGTGVATVTVDGDGNRSSDGDTVLVTSGSQSTAPTAANFNVSGEPSTTISITAADVSLSDGNSHTLTAQPSFAGAATRGSGATSTTGSASLSSAGALLLKVGGTLNLPAGVTAAAYTGELNVTVAYN